MAIVLYDYMLSGSCYKVRLFLSILDLDYESKLVDYFPGRRHREPDFLELNPLGQLPVLVDGDVTLRDAQAILVYLATKYDRGGTWYPDEPAARGRTAMWLSFAGGELMSSSAARLHDMLGYPGDIEALRAEAKRAFRILDDHLTEQEFEDLDWVAGPNPTVADIACFPYVALGNDGGIPLDDYPAIGRWLRRVMDQPGLRRHAGHPGGAMILGKARSAVLRWPNGKTESGWCSRS